MKRRKKWAEDVHVENPGRITKGVLRFARWVVAPIVKILYRPTLEGIENLPEQGPFLLVSNHSAGFHVYSLGKPLSPEDLFDSSGKASDSISGIGNGVPGEARRDGEGNEDDQRRVLDIVQSAAQALIDKGRPGTK